MENYVFLRTLGEVLFGVTLVSLWWYDALLEGLESWILITVVSHTAPLMLVHHHPNNKAHTQTMVRLASLISFSMSVEWVICMSNEVLFRLTWLHCLFLLRMVVDLYVLFFLT